MSDDFAFAAPPFRPDEALVGLKRQLRECKLTERGQAFELRGQPVVELAVVEGAIAARLAKRPARSPEWTAHRLKSGADVRGFVDTVKRQLGRWSAADE